jgi:hypothetical protein
LTDDYVYNTNNTLHITCIIELDINDWHRWGYRYNNYWPVKDSDRVPRIDCALVSKLDFVTLYEQPRKPVIILGCTRHWSAEANWTPEVRNHIANISPINNIT